ncbi:MAG: response regulator [Hyphomicrobiales bacterium]|nr:response regulator [Hyphomicrobiales bacterium]
MTEELRIAVVDDDVHTRETVADYLELHAFAVLRLDGAAALRAALEGGMPDLVVLDLHMPGEDGLSLIRFLKERHPHLPVIMLTSTASAIDRVVGLELGADDYLAKPAELRELVARIRSVLRRARLAATIAPQSAPTPPRLVRFGRRVLDLDSRRLRDETSGEEALLQTSEFALLKAFVEHPGRVLSREQLLDLANARDPDAFDRAIDVRIARIRKKIEVDPGEPVFIRTVRGAGYVYEPERG